MPALIVTCENCHKQVKSGIETPDGTATGISNGIVTCPNCGSLIQINPGPQMRFAGPQFQARAQRQPSRAERRRQDAQERKRSRSLTARVASNQKTYKPTVQLLNGDEEGDAGALSRYLKGTRRGRIEEVCPYLPGIDSVQHGLKIWEAGLSLAVNGTSNGGPVRLSAAYIDSDRINGFAAKEDGVYLIGIYSGVRRKFLALFYGLLSQPDVFPTLSNNPASKPYFGSKLFHPISSVDIEPFPDPPLDPVRRAFSERLAFLAERMAFHHEVAHIRNGHVDWLRSRTGIAYIDELNWGDERSIGDVDRLTLEWDADTHAIVSLLHDTTEATVRQDKDRARLVIPERTRFGGLDAALTVCSFIAYSVFRIMTPIRKLGTLEEELTRTHVHPTVRIRMNHGTLITNLAHTAEIDPEPYRKHMSQGVAMAEKAWSNMSGDELLDIDADQVKDVEQKLGKLFERRWVDLHPELNALKLAGVLPPVEAIQWPFRSEK